MTFKVIHDTKRLPNTDKYFKFKKMDKQLTEKSLYHKKDFLLMEKLLMKKRLLLKKLIQIYSK